MTISLATKYRIAQYVLHNIPLPAVNQLKYLGIPYRTILNGTNRPLQLSPKLAKPWDFSEETLNWLHKRSEN